MGLLQQLQEILRERVLVTDGAMGTMIQTYRLSEQDFRGERFADHDRNLKGNNDLLVLTKPQVIREIHRQYLDAGADLLLTATFNGTSISQSDYGTEGIVYELNVEAAKLARELCEEFTSKNPNKPRFVMGDIGPTNRTLSLSPDINDPGFRAVTFDDMVV